MVENETKKTEPVVEEVEEVKPPAVVDKKEPTMVEKANEAAERLEKANTEKERLLLKEEQLLAEKRLGGKTEAGSTAQTEEEKITEGAKKILKGTGYETMFDGAA